MYNLERAIAECRRNDFFHFPTLFLKQPPEATSITLIGISYEVFRAKKECFESGGITIETYEISLDYCMSLILSHDILLNSLFSTTVCLKDDLDISRKILQSLKPILLYNNMEKAPAISQIWDVAVSEPASPDDELAMRFYDISDDISFIFNVFIPIQNMVRSCVDTHTPFLQFYNINGRKDAVYSTRFDNGKESRKALLSTQKMLYLQSSEFNCRNIRIPYHHMPCVVEVKCKPLYDELLSLTFEFQSIILSGGKEGMNVDAIMTEMLYAYTLIAKVFYSDYSSFKSFNDMTYKRYTWTTVSDTIKYLLSHNMMVQAENKIAREHKALCMANAQSLFTNYADMIQEWKDYDNCKKEYHSYLKQLKRIKKMKDKYVSKEDVVSEIIEQLFHSFDIASYYHSYIPYCINFIKNEI